MKPTQKEIENEVHGCPNEFRMGFANGVEWLLNWQKTQELETRCHCGEIEIEPHTCPYREEYNDSKTCRCCSVCKKRCADDI
jgi:hypothetical protein